MTDDLIKKIEDRLSERIHMDEEAQLVEAIQQVLRVERTDRGFVRADDPETTRWMQGFDTALDAVVEVIAEALGVSHEAPEPETRNG